MISATPVLAGLTMVLLCLALASVLLPLNRLPLAMRLLIIVGITLTVLLPLSNYPGWYYVRSIFGDCSITALFFYVALILQQNFSLQLYQENELVLLRRLVLAASLLLYPFALGLTQFDSYSPGYASSPWLLAVLFLITLFCWYRKYYFLAVTLTATAAAWSLQLLESRNLWDYLIDPALLLIMILTWLRPSVKKMLPSL